MEILDEMMLVFANHRLTYWKASGGHTFACTCGWNGERFEDPWQVNKAAGRHLAEKVEHLVREEVSEALDAHEEAVRMLSGEVFEYCVEYNPYAKLNYTIPARPLERTNWTDARAVQPHYKLAKDEGYQPRIIKRRKPGPEIEVTNNA